MDIKLGGKTHRIERLDMDDAEWADAKKTAIDNGTFHFAHDREVDVAEKNAAESKALDEKLAGAKKVYPRNENGVRIEQDPEEMIHVQDKDGNEYTMKRKDQASADPEKLKKQFANPQDGREGSGTLGGKLKSIASKLFEGSVPEKKSPINVDDLGPGDREGENAPAPTTKPSQAMRAGLGNAFKQSQNEARVSVGEPTSFSTTPEEAQVTVGEPTNFTVSTPDVAPAAPPLGAIPGQWMNERTAQPEATPAPQGGVLVDMPPVQPRGYLEGRTPQKDGTMKETVAPPVPGATSHSASMSSKDIPGGPQLPAVTDRTKEVETAFANADLARRKSAELESAGLKDQADIANEGRLQQLTMESDRRQSEMRQQDDVRQKQAAYQKTIDAMSAPEKIDRDRWWNSRSTGQKIFAVMSAGLTRGATLQMFQHAIDSDIDVQQNDIANARSANAQKAAGQHNVIQMARQNGMDENEARLTAQAHAWDNIDRATKIASMNTKSQSVIAAAAEQSALAQQQKIEALTKLDNYQQTNAIEREKLRLESRKISVAERKAAAGGKAKAEKKPEAVLVKLVNDADEGVASVDRMLKILGKEDSIPGGIVDEGMKHVPKTDAYGRNKEAKIEARSLMMNIDHGSALQAHDQAFYKENGLGEVGTNNWDQSALRGLRQKFIDSKKNALKNIKQSGRDASGFDDSNDEMSEEDAYGTLLEGQ